MSRRDAWICIFFGLFAFWGIVAAVIVGAVIL